MENQNFIVSARKYRPSTFSTVVGQKNLTSTLQNAIVTDRLAHSYLFCGSRGVGKTSCARIFAKTINCENRTPDGNPCNECESCRSFNEGRSFNIIELDAASNNGVDDMRRLTEQVMVPPTSGRYRVFIIDEVHMLSTQAFNAFLKTLEEPPSYIIFILATTEKHKIIPTILSRCQIYDFNRITVNDITDHLAKVAEAENVKADRHALAVIARQADGALRDALSIFDQIVASSKGNITYQSVIDNLNILDNSYFIRLFDAFHRSDVAEALLIFKDIRDKGFNTHFFINGLQTFARNLMVARDPRTLPLLDATDEEKEQMKELAGQFTPEFFFMALSLINDADMRYREASNKTFLTELLLIKLCQLLSPSPVFRGKEEGHLDSLLPLGSIKPEAAPHSPAPAPERQAAADRPAQPSMPTANQPSPKPATEPSRATAPASTDAAPTPPRPKILATGLKVKSLKSTPRPETDGGATQPGAGDNGPARGAGTPVSAEALNKAWGDYAALVPDKKMLVNLMRAVTPTLEAGNPGTVKFTVHNPLQKEIMEKERERLLEFLRSSLGSGPLQLLVEVVEDSGNPAMWSEREILQNMLDSHPGMAKFMNDLELSLS